MIDKKYFISVPVETTRESIRVAFLKANKNKEATNEILLDKMLFLISEIHRLSLKYFFENEDGIELTHLMSKYLKDNLGRSGGVTYRQVVDYLIFTNIIEVDDSFKTGNYSKSYGLVNRNKLFHVYQVELKHWQPKPRKGSLESTQEGLGVLEAINANIGKILVDMDYVELVNMQEVNRYAILSILYNISSSPKRSNPSKIENKSIKRIYVKTDEYGRVHHNITGVGRTYRPAFTIEGEEIYSVDLSASQMYFSIKGLTGYAKMKANSKDLELAYNKFPDVPKFIESVLSGEFYLAINEYLGFTEEELKANKIKTLMPIFSKKDPKRKTKYLKALETVFPTFLAYINTKKKNDYADAAKYLQSQESMIMIEGVCSKLIELGVWFVPVHDCILCKKGDIDIVKEIIEDTCIKYNGCKPHSKTSNWTGEKQKLKHLRTPEEQASFLLKNIIAYKDHQKQEATNRIVNNIKNKAKRKQTKEIK